MLAAAAVLALGSLTLAGAVLLQPALAHSAGVLFGCLLAAACAVALLRACLRVDQAGVARSLDRSHGLPDTLQSALQFSAASGASPTGFVAALLREAQASAERLSPARAVPMTVAKPVVVAVLSTAICVWCLARAESHFVLPGSLMVHGSARLKTAPATTAQASPAEDPIVTYRRLARAVSRAELSPGAAVAGLLEVERTLRARTVDALDPGLVEQLTSLFARDGAPDGLRSLASLSNELVQPASPERRQEQARFIEEKRRELEHLRKQYAKNAAAQRELSELSKRLSEAQQKLQQEQPEQAAQQLDAAKQQLARQQKQQKQQTEARAIQQQAEQLREHVQRSAGARAAESPAEAERRSQNERHFREQAGEGSEQATESSGPRASAGEASGSGDNPGATAGGEPENDEQNAEPDLFATSDRPRVSLDDHAATSLPGEGDSRSEVILMAADRGFASAPYRKVYADYRNHAEELLAQDQIPAAYRFYVRRYFQLIEPRKPGRARISTQGQVGGNE